MTRSTPQSERDAHNAASTREHLREVNVNGVRYFQADDVERWHRGMVARAEEWDELSEQVETLEAQLAHAERVLRVISGWNVDLVSTADAISPALGYFAAKEAIRGDA